MLPLSSAFSSQISLTFLTYADLFFKRITQHVSSTSLQSSSHIFHTHVSITLFKTAFPGDISPSSLPMFLMLHSPNIKVGYGITEEAKLDRQSDRKTNGSSLVSRHCSLFLNLAQMLRFKTKLVAVIFSQPFLKRCHLVGVEVRCVLACAHMREMCKAGALLCICGCLRASTYIYMWGGRGVCACVHCVCVCI